jgi:hypothetical protein
MEPRPTYVKLSRILIAYLFSIICGYAYAANENYPAGARSAGMSGVGVMSSDFWSCWQNQAGLGFYPELTFGFHHENRFVVPQYNLHSMGLTIPTGTGTIGMSYSYFGYSRYHESKIGLALGKSFHDRIAVGLQLDYLSTYIDDELGSSGTLAVEAGIMAEPVDNLLLGFHVFNPTGSRIQKMKDERIPMIMRLGLGYKFGEQLFVGIETEKDLEVGGPAYKLGVEYHLIEYIYARGGIRVLENVDHSFGLGFKLLNFRADIAFSYHQILGYTPYFSLIYRIK